MSITTDEISASRLGQLQQVMQKLYSNTYLDQCTQDHVKAACVHPGNLNLLIRMLKNGIEVPLCRVEDEPLRFIPGACDIAVVNGNYKALYYLLSFVDRTTVDQVFAISRDTWRYTSIEFCNALCTACILNGATRNMDNTAVGWVNSKFKKVSSLKRQIVILLALKRRKTVMVHLDRFLVRQLALVIWAERYRYE